MVVISTFVIFDIETTGLPRYERNRTKFTELTFLAVDRRDLESTKCGEKPLVNKLSYLFNPQRPIQPEVTNLTGLSRTVLQYQPTFKNRIPSLSSFLEYLPKPVCLVAHNGNSFDFKLLRNEYIDAGAELPPDLLCVDSLWGFKRILNETNISYETLLRKNSSKCDDDMLTDDEDEWPVLNTTTEEWEQIDKLVESFSNMAPVKDSGDTLSITEIHERDKIHVNKAATIKNVFDKKPKTDNICCTLQALYKRLLNKEAVNAHRSEADCFMLLECMVALKEQFLPYADSKCKLLSDIQPFERH